MSALYLYINLAVLAVPLALSFDRRVAFFRLWPYVLPAIAINAAIFIAWDALFTERGIWGFNPDYLIGVNVLGLPLEECLFFFTVPYACVLIYETLRVYTSLNPSSAWIWQASSIAALVLAVLAFVHYDRWYSVSALGLAALLLLLSSLIRPQWMGRFWVFFAVQLLPFFVVNSLLTGAFTPEPIVWYNPDHHIGPRLGTIPFEDVFYSFSMLLIPVSLFEGLRARSPKFALIP